MTFPQERASEVRALSSRINQYPEVNARLHGHQPHRYGHLLSSLVLVLEGSEPDVVGAAMDELTLKVDVVVDGLCLSGQIELDGEDGHDPVSIKVTPLSSLVDVQVSASVSVFNSDGFGPDWPGAVVLELHFADGSAVQFPSPKPQRESDGTEKVLSRCLEIMRNRIAA